MSAKRGTRPYVDEPMHVGNTVIEKCRNYIDGNLKAAIRKAVNLYYKTRYRISEVGEGVQFGRGAQVPKGSRIGKYCYIGSGFSSPSPVRVGDLCMISTSVKIVGSDHGIDNPRLPTRLDFRWKHKVTTFEVDVWVGHDVIMISGVTIGAGSVVATGSVVVKDVPRNSIVGGNPAKKIRNRFTEAEWEIYCHELGIPYSQQIDSRTPRI